METIYLAYYIRVIIEKAMQIIRIIQISFVMEEFTEKHWKLIGCQCTDGSRRCISYFVHLPCWIDA